LARLFHGNPAVRQSVRGLDAIPMTPDVFERLRTQGTKVYYLHVCRRKLWWFAHHVTMEHDSDLVALGRLLHRTAYPRQPRREFDLDGLVRIDLVERSIVREIKHSMKQATAARAQLLYYLYYLKRRGLVMEGLLAFPRQKRQERVILTPDDEARVLQWLQDIRDIESRPTPPRVDFMPLCRRCAYLSLCWG
jgi:CRISPR-associated exonuclease Cas4